MINDFLHANTFSFHFRRSSSHEWSIQGSASQTCGLQNSGFNFPFKLLMVLNLMQDSHLTKVSFCTYAFPIFLLYNYINKSRTRPMGFWRLQHTHVAYTLRLNDKFCKQAQALFSRSATRRSQVSHWPSLVFGIAELLLCWLLVADN